MKKKAAPSVVLFIRPRIVERKSLKDGSILKKIYGFEVLSAEAFGAAFLDV